MLSIAITIFVNFVVIIGSLQTIDFFGFTNPSAKAKFV